MIKTIINKYSLYAKTAGIYLTATVISSVIGVLINPLLAMNLSPENYASIGYYGAYSTLLGPVIGFFMIDYFLRTVINTKIQKQAVVVDSSVRSVRLAHQ